MSALLYDVMQQTAPSHSSTHSVCRVLAAGILLNVSSVSHNMPDSLVQAVLCVLRDVLSLNLNDALTELSKAVQNMKGNCESTQHCESVDKSSPLASLMHAEVKDMRVSELSYSMLNFLTAQQVALEILTNLSCQGGQDSGDWEDVEEMEDEGDMMEADIMEEEAADDAQINTCIIQHDLFRKVLQCVECWDGDVLQSLAECTDGRKVLEKLGCVR